MKLLNINEKGLKSLISKKLILILAIITILIVSGCGKEEPGYTKPVTETKEPTVSQKDLGAEEIPKEEETAPVEVEEVSTLSSEVQEVVDKASSVDSMQYSYNEFIKGTTGYAAKVWVKGNKMKQVIEPGSGTWDLGNKFDTIYIDLAAKTAEAYCEDKDCDDRNAVISAEYSGFVVETPFDILESLKGVKVGEEQYDNKESFVIRSETDDGNILNVWLWTYNGLPLKYEITTPDKERLQSVVFSKLLYNDVKDSELEHQTLKN